jgi:hypothetical protein
VRELVGPGRVSVIAAAVALSLAATPNLAAAGRTVAGRLRLRAVKERDPELQMQEVTAPVLIVGMGAIGRTLADALHEFNISYHAVERDQRRLSEAVADGYLAVYGDMADPRLWATIAMRGRRISALTAPSYEVSSDLTPVAQHLYPNLLRFAVVMDDAEAGRFHALGMRAVVDRSVPPGLEFAAAVLAELGIGADALEGWMQRQRNRALGGTSETFVAA